MKARLSKNNKFITIVPTPDFYAKNGLRVYIYGSFDEIYKIPNEPIIATTDIIKGQKRYYFHKDVKEVFKADIAHYFENGKEFFVSPDLSHRSSSNNDVCSGDKRGRAESLGRMAKV